MPTASSACHLAVSAWLVWSITSLPIEDTGSPSSGNGPYSGYQVLQIHFDTQADATMCLSELSAKYQLDVWRRAFNGTVDVMVPPQHIKDVTEFVTSRGASYDVQVTDVQRLLKGSIGETRQDHRRRRSARLPPEIVMRRYLRFRQIRQILRKVRHNATFADVRVFNLGRTAERRVTPCVTIRHKNARDANKKAIVIEAGMHAREWIAPAMALNIIYKLAYNVDNDPDMEDLLQKFDWMIIPVANPDGYIFSQRNISTRLWRKTRTSLYARGVAHCFGVDGNRNFGFQWTDRTDKGGSPNPCDDNFSGPQGFSEPETRNVRSLLMRLRNRTALFLSLHSFGQFFLYPWGYDSAAILEDEEDLREIAEEFAEVMLQRNRWYETGSSAQVLYAAAGASDDFARGGAGVKYAFTIELSPSDASHYGFLLPPRRIATVVEDHWPAFKAIALTIWDRLNSTSTSYHPTTTTTTTPTTTHTPTNPPPPTASAQGSSHVDDTQHTSLPSATTAAAAAATAAAATAAAASRGSNSGDGLTEVNIDGHTFRLNLNDPAVAQWMEYYMQLLHFRNRYSGK